MKCKYCGEPLLENDNVCPSCKKSQVEGEMEVFSDMVEKKGHKVIWAVIVVVVLLLGAVGFVYYRNTRPEVVFTKLLNNVYKSTVNKEESYKQVKAVFDMKATVDAGEEYKELTDLINNMAINLSVNYDLNSEVFVLNLGANYNEKTLANVNMYYEKDVVYVELKDLFDKLIKLDVDAEEKVEINEDDIKVIIDEVYNALKVALKEGKYVTSKAKVNNQDVNKNTLIINNENKDALVNAFVDHLLNSNNFIDAVSKISEMSNDEVKEMLKESKELDDLDEEIYVSIYTKKLTNDFVKFELGTKDEVLMSLTEESKDVCKMELTDLEGSKITATITADEKNNKVSIVYNLEVEGVKVNLTMNTSYVYNEKIEKPNTDNSVSMEELTEEDSNKILENLMENEGIVEFMNVIESMMPGSDGDLMYEDSSYVG